MTHLWGSFCSIPSSARPPKHLREKSDPPSATDSQCRVWAGRERRESLGSRQRGKAGAEGTARTGICSSMPIDELIALGLCNGEKVGALIGLAARAAE